jgi:hypothetical protein
MSPRLLLLLLLSLRPSHINGQRETVKRSDHVGSDSFSFPPRLNILSPFVPVRVNSLFYDFCLDFFFSFFFLF